MGAIPQFHHPSLAGRINFPGTSDLQKVDSVRDGRPESDAPWFPPLSALADRATDNIKHSAASRMYKGSCIFFCMVCKSPSYPETLSPGEATTTLRLEGVNDLVSMREYHLQILGSIKSIPRRGAEDAEKFGDKALRSLQLCEE